MSSTDERIADLFQGGYGVDYISERGVVGHWTRMDVLRVASERGWELDKSGRIPRPQRPAPRPPTALRPGRVMDEPRPGHPRPTPPPSPKPLTRPGATVDSTREKISAALKHEQAAVQKAAKKANDALATLDRLLADWDAKALARERIAELEAELAQAKAALRGGGTAQAAVKGEHAKAREWARANGIDVPPIGRVPGPVLERWRSETAA